jgi:hypothetical protein
MVEKSVLPPTQPPDLTAPTRTAAVETSPEEHQDTTHLSHSHLPASAGQPRHHGFLAPRPNTRQTLSQPHRPRFLALRPNKQQTLSQPHRPRLLAPRHFSRPSGIDGHQRHAHNNTQQQVPHRSPAHHLFIQICPKETRTSPHHLHPHHRRPSNSSPHNMDASSQTQCSTVYGISAITPRMRTRSYENCNKMCATRRLNSNSATHGASATPDYESANRATYAPQKCSPPTLQELTPPSQKNMSTNSMTSATYTAIAKTRTPLASSE